MSVGHYCTPLSCIHTHSNKAVLCKCQNMCEYVSNTSLFDLRYNKLLIVWSVLVDGFARHHILLK